MSALAAAALVLAELGACRSHVERARVAPRVLDAIDAIPRTAMGPALRDVERDVLDGMPPDAESLHAALRTIGRLSLDAAAPAPPSRPCMRPPASATALAEEQAAASERTTVAPSAGAAEEADPASQTEPCAPPDGSEVWELDADSLPEPPSEPLPLVTLRGTVFAPALVAEGGL